MGKLVKVLNGKLNEADETQKKTLQLVKDLKRAANQRGERICATGRGLTRKSPVILGTKSSTWWMPGGWLRGASPCLGT
jgi:hypothetical protein